MKVKNIFENDPLFQKYMTEDCETFNKDLKENQINFILEEAVMLYLLTKNQIRLPNEYIENQQKWILFCYPGNPSKSIIYLYQRNPFKLDWKENPYQDAHYNLETKKLIDFNRVDLESYSVK